MANGAPLDTISPFFIVADLTKAVEYYNEKLGFKTDLLVPDKKPFFGIVRRDGVRILLKEIGPDVHPVPNHARHEWARWDALIMCQDPDAVFSEFQACGIPFHEPIEDTEDGLRAFEIKDKDGYVLCFACPL